MLRKLLGLKARKWVQELETVLELEYGEGDGEAVITGDAAGEAVTVVGDGKVVAFNCW